MLRLSTSQHLFNEDLSVLNAPINERSRSLIIVGAPGTGKSRFIETLSRIYYIALLNEKDFNLHFVNADSMP